MSVDFSELLEWLVEEKNMTIRSAKDVLSRCGRVYKMLSVNELNSKSLEDLQKNEQFNSASMFIKSQLKRAVTLYLEFTIEREKD